MLDNNADYLHRDLALPSLFLLRDVQQVRLAPAKTRALSSTSAHMVVIVTEGTGFVSDESAPCEVTTGSALLVAQAQASLIQAIASDKEPLTFLLFYFDVLQPGKSSENAFIPNHSWKADHDALLVYSTDSCTELAATIYSHREASEPLDMFQNQIRFQQLLHSIWSSNKGGTETEAATSGIDHTVSYIHKHYAESISLGDLANRAGLTPRYYTEVFKKNVGKSPIEYVTNYRMEQAKKLLIDSDKRLRDVARLVGYEDEFYFSRRFKQQVGVSPTVFVRMSQKQFAPITFQYAEYVIALGIRPVGAPEEQVHYLREQLRLKEADSIISLSRDYPELIKPLQPTFILTDYKRDYATLSKIAPTLALPWLDHDVFGHLQRIADVLDVKEKASLWIKQHEQKVQKARQSVDASIQKQETVSILNVRPNSLFAYGVRNIGHVLYRSLKLTPPPIMQEKLKRDPNFWAMPIQEKQLRAYAADWLFVHVFEDDLSHAHFKALMNQEEWQQIPAVQKGQVVMIDTTWFAYDPLSLDVQLDEAVQFLTKQKRSDPPYYPNKNGISSMDETIKSR